MRYLKKFENFNSEEEYNEPLEDAFYDMEGTCEPCDSDEEEEDYIELPEDPMNDPITLEKKGSSYKKSGLKNPEKADLNKDKKISSYEKKRGKAIQDSMEDKEEEKGKGLTAKQKKLPEGLRKAIERKMKK
jgi:hypothetical protein